MVSQSAVLVLLALATCSGIVQGVNHEGNEFLVAFGPNQGDSLDASLLVTTDEEETVSFWVAYNEILGNRVTGAVINNTHTVQKGGETRITIPRSNEISGSFTIDPSKTITIKASDDKLLTVVGVNEESASTDAFLALPKIVTKTGTYEYFVMSAESSTLSGSTGARSFFAIITNEDDTTITINPKDIIRVPFAPGRFIPGRETAATIANKGTLIAGVSRTDLTGTRITSNKPLTLTSGHECTHLPINLPNCDHMVEYFPPTEAWGMKFFLVPLKTRSADGYRIMTSKDSTQCQVTCNDKAGNPSHSEEIVLQNAGDFRQFIYSNDRFCCVECNQPCLMVQYSLSSGYDNNLEADPFMSMIPPLQQYSKDYETIFFESLSLDTQGVRVKFDAQMSLVLPVECSPDGLQFEGNPVNKTFVDIKCSDGSVCGRGAQFDPTENTGVHTLTHTDPDCKFMFTIYGWDRENSYGYVAGMEVDPIAATIFCLEESSLTVTEASGVMKFTATRSGPVGQSACIGIAVGDITTQSTDYETPSDCCFAAGEVEATCNITIVSDAITESDEMFNITLNPSSGQCICEDASIKVTIEDMPPPAITVQFDPVVYNVSEDVGTAVLTLTADSAAQSAYTVTVTTQDGTAVDGEDYTGGTYTATFPPGSTTASVSISIIDDSVLEGTESFTGSLSIPQASADLGVSAGDDDTATVNILDDDDVTVQFNPTQYNVSEGDGEVELTLVASGAASFDYTVEVDTVDGTAVGGDDYTGRTYTATFTAGSTTASVSIPITDDNVLEGTESFTGSLSIPQASADLGVSAGSADTATVNILDDDTSTVQFNPTQYSVNEGDGEVELTLVASAAASFDYTVQVDTADGTATGDTGFITSGVDIGDADFQEGGYLVTFSAGETTATVTVPINDDDIAEPTENFTAVLTIPAVASARGVTKGAADTASIDIADNDAVKVIFNPTQYSVNEGDGSVTLTLTADKAASFDYTVEVLTQDGTATAPSDYTAGPYSVTFPAGSTTATVTIPIEDDSVLEGSESFTATISTANTGFASVSAGDDDTATVNIVDNDGVIVQFNPTQYSVTEGDGEVELTLVASAAATFDYTVDVDTVNGAAIGGVDFQSGGYQVTFSAGQTTATVAIPITDDDISEVTEDFSAVLTIPAAASTQGVSSGTADTASIDIVDNDAVEVIFNPTQYSVNEGDGSVTLTLSADKAASSDYTVEVLTQDGTATAPSDYTAGPYSVTFPAGSTTATVTIPIADDTALEGPESFTATISTANTRFASVSAGDDDTATINIVDDDGVFVQFNPIQYSVNEGDGEVELTLVASAAASFNYVVKVDTVDGTAVGDADFQSGGYYGVFPAGQTTATVTIPITNDDISELNETFTANLTIPANASSLGVSKGDADTATITIIDNDPIKVNFNPTQYSVNEGDGSVTLTLIADKVASFDYTVEVLTQDGTATAPSDYTAGPYSVTFPAGSTTATVTIPIEDDNVYEGKIDPEQFTATISTANTGVPSVSAGDDDTATVSIVDNEDNTISFQRATYTALETVGDFTEVRLVSSLPFLEDTEVTVSFEDITATGGPDITVDGVDYGNSPVTVTFAAGQTVSTPVSIPIKNDQIFEPSEQFRATFELPSGFVNLQKGSPSEAVVTIQESETLTVEFDPTEYSVSEDDPFAQLNITASLPASFAYDVTVTTADISATGGDDYVGGTFTVTIPAGQTQVSQRIPIIEDAEAEGTESFQAQLTLPSASESLGVTLGDDDTATVNIIDNDGVIVSFSPAGYTVNEGDGEVVLTLTANRPASFNYTVSVDTVDGTAMGDTDFIISGVDIGDADFQEGGYQVTFLAGQTTATVTIPINDDDICEVTEDFSAVLTIPTDASSLGVNKGMDDTASINIEDNDAVEVNFNPIQYTVNEGDGTVTLTLTADGVAQCSYTVEIITQDGSATADYLPGPYNVTFTAGSTTATVDIPIVDDGIYEANIGLESFTATISTIYPGCCSVSIGPDNPGTINITDNEDLVVQFNPVTYSVLESGGNAVLTLETDKPFEHPFTVEVNTADGTAVAPGDYTAGGYTAQFNPSSQQSSVSVPIIDDTPLQEGPENFTATVSISQALQDANVRVGTNDMATVNIVDVAVSVTVEFDPDSYTVDEAEGLVSVMLVSSMALDQAYVVQVMTSDGNTTAGADYADDTYDAVFAANATTANVFIPIMDDNVCETLEEFFGNLVIPDAAMAFGVVAGTRNTATIAIKDNDIAGVQFDPVEYVVREEAGNAVLSLTSNITCQFDFSVTVDVSDGTATGGDDYGTGPFTATFPAGSDTSSVSVPIIDDQLQEDDETFTAQLQIPSDIQDSVVGGANTNAEVTIKDNEADIVVNFNPAQYEVSEDGTSVTVTLVASRNSTVPYSINVITADGTATSPDDYTGGTYTVMFPAGQTTVMVEIPIVNDTDPCECVEDFTASIEVPSEAAALGVVAGVNDTATISIVDDEICPIIFNPDQYSVAEDVVGGTVEVCLMVERNCIGDFSVQLQTTDGTATAGEDYDGGPYTVTFASDANMACTDVTIIDDEIFEGDQNFFIDIVVPPEVPLTPMGRANVTIQDDDTDVVCSVKEDSVTVDESQGGVTLDITISREVEVPFVCEIATEPISAEEQTDFEPITETIVFRPQEDTTKEVRLQIVDDDIAESPENLRLVVQDAGGQQAPVPINVTIIDDDLDIQCLISDSLQILPFTGTNGYGFRETCEFQLVTVCPSSGSPNVPLSIVVDYQNDNFEMGQVGIKWREEIVIINENNTLSFGGTDSGEIMTFSNATFISVDIEAAGVTVEKHIGTESSLSVSVSNTSDLASQLCGLCGDRQGTLRLKDGQTTNNQTVFLAEYKVEPSEQILMRAECINMTDDMVIGDPLYAVPLSLPEDTVQKYGHLSLCYEVHGKANRTFNLVSDTCVSVNAYYVPMKNPTHGNIIGKIAVLAEDNKDVCQQIEVDLEGCTASVNGQVMSSYQRHGIYVKRRTSRVRIAAPNCENIDLVMWVICEVREKQPMIQFTISRGMNLRPTSHGLIGQFWNIEVTAEKYNVTDKDHIDPHSTHFAVTVKTPSGGERRFFAELYQHTWDSGNKPCLYAGNSQGGKTFEVRSLPDPVIEGHYSYYIVDNLFSPNFKFSQFKSDCPTKA